MPDFYEQPRSTVQVHAISPERDSLEIRFPRVASYRVERPDDRLEAERAAGEPVTAVLDPFSPVGTTRDVNFTTSKERRWRTRADRSHVNWAVGDSDWELEFCAVAEASPDALAYVKNQGMGFEVPYRTGGQYRTYAPDFILRISDTDPDAEPLYLVVEVKGFRGEDAKEKAATMRHYWVPGVNRLGGLGYWQFVELRNNWDYSEDLKTAIAQARREAQNFREGRPSLDSREAVLAVLRELKPRLRQDFGISSLQLFGSFARDEAQLISDVDLIVEYSEKPTSWGSHGEGAFLEAALGRNVEIAVGKNLRAHVRPSAEREAIDV